MASPRPAYKRRVVLYDLNDAEKELVQKYADEDRRSISVWVAQAVRAELKRRQGK